MNVIGLRVETLYDLYGIDGVKTAKGSKATVHAFDADVGRYELCFAGGEIRIGFLLKHLRVLSPIEMLAETVE